MNTISTLLVVSILAWMIAYLFIRDLDPKFEILYLISFISIFITGFFSIFMNQKNDYGQIISAKVLGFRNYLITAEKNELEALVLDDPDYFYNILPYTYALGISEKWINNFEKNNVSNIDIKLWITMKVICLWLCQNKRGEKEKKKYIFNVNTFITSNNGFSI